LLIYAINHYICLHFTLFYLNITMENILEKVGNKIKTIRQAKNLTQEQIADLLNMSHSGYSKIERGEIDLNMTRLEQIAKLFNMQPSEIIQFGETHSFIFHITNGNGLGTVQGSVYFGNKEEIDGLRKEIDSLKKEITKLKKE
jgi:transcriptional regulator with XRE-family HTH domain